MSSPQISSSTHTQNSDPPAQLVPSDSQQISSDDSGDVSANSHSQPFSEESQTSPELSKNSSHHPRKVIVYSRRHILNLSSSPLVQRPEGMPALKDWFGDWSEQHSNTQTKKDTSDPNNTSGNRRFPRREQEEGETTRSTFRSTLSQPSQMGNFRHQSIRGDLTRSGDRDTDRDKEGHERLRSLSDMYDRERFGLTSTITPLMRSQARDSSGHHPSSSVSGSGTSTRLTGRVDRDRDKDSTRRNENREPARRKGGESIDWRRGVDAPRLGKDEQTREGERDRSPEVDRSRRGRSTSRDRWFDREDNRRGRDVDDKDKETDKTRSREEDRKFKLKESESHNAPGTSNRWSGQTDEKRRPRDEADKDTKEEKRDRGGRDKNREHPDIKRDRELRDGWTIISEEKTSTRRTPGRGGERRTNAADEDRDIRKEREKEKEPAWMDDYVPEAGAPKAGIFGGKVEGMEDEIQAWKRKQATAKQQPTATLSNTASTVLPTSNGVISSSASSESLPRDGTVITTELIPPNTASLTTDEQAKASDAFFFGLMKGESKTKSHNTTPAKSPEPEISSANRSPAPMIPLSTTVDPAKVDPAVISVAAQGSSKPNNSPSTVPRSGSASSLPHSHDTPQTIHRSSPGPSLPAFASSTPGPIGSSALNNNDPSLKIIPATTPPASVSFNPPTQSRVLASHRNTILSPTGQHPVSPAGIIGSQPSPKPFPNSRGQPSPLVSDPAPRGSSSGLGDTAAQRIQALENLGVRSPFSPFDNNNIPNAVDNGGAGGPYSSSRQSSVDLRGGFNAVDALLPDRNPRSSPQTLLASSSVGQAGTHDSTPSPSSSSYPSGRGSRFAKFWDKNKEAAAGGPNAVGMGGFPATNQQGVQVPPQSVSPSVSQQGRQHDMGPSNLNGFPGNSPMDNIQDMLAMLQNSQGARITPQGLMHRPSIPSHLQTLHEQQIPHHQPQPQHHFTNANNLLDPQYDNRSSFVPDGLVPGLRPARNRDGSIYTSDGIEEATTSNSPFSVSVQQRQGQSQQQQQYDRQTSGVGGLPPIYNSQNAGGNIGVGLGVGMGMGGGGGVGGGGNNGSRMFQPPFRAEPSLLNAGGPNTLQRLPPGLANLGGRPPHDPNAYLNGGIVGGLNLGMGLGGGGMQGPVNAVSGGGGSQHQQHQPFNGFGGNVTPTNNFGIGGGMGVGGMSGLGGMNVGVGGAGIGGPGGQRAGGPGGQLPLQSLLNSGGNAMISPASHHLDFTVHHPHHPGAGVRGPPQGIQGQHPLVGGGGPPPSGIPSGARGGFVQPGVSGPILPGPGGLPPLQAQLGLRQPQQQPQQQQMLPGMIPPPQMQHLGPQQPGGMHGLHHGHGHGHGQSQNEHLLSMLMGGLVPRE